jgi:hypothetical protein
MPRAVPARAASASAGARDRHTPVSKLVAKIMKGVIKHFKDERIKAEKAAKAAKDAQRDADADAWIAQKYAEQREKDAKSIDALLGKEECAVRLRLRPPEPSRGVLEWLAKSRWNRLAPFRFAINATSRLESAVVKRRRRRREHDAWAMRKVLPTLLRKSDAPPPPPVHDVLAADAAEDAARSGVSRQAKWVPPPLSAEAIGPAARKLDFVALAAEHVAELAEAEWAAESRQERSARQKEHGCKSLLGMTDDIFYKHLRDNVLEPAEAREELQRRKRCIHNGQGATYGPPEGLHPTFGLMEEEEEGDDGDAPRATAPPASPHDPADVYADWLRSPWEHYLQQKKERELCEAAAKWVAA